jgi:hypothetical protein
VLAGGDWIPGAIIVAAALVGLARQIPLIRKLCTGPTEGGEDDDHHFFRASGRGA